MADQNFRVKRGLEVGIGATVLTALSSGRVGIGTTNPTAQLQVGSGSSAVVVDTDGRLIFGKTTTTDISGFNSYLQLQGTNFDTASIALSNNAGNNTGSYILLGKARSGFAGGYVSVANGDNLGQLRFMGADGTKYVESAYIGVTCNGIPGIGTMPGRMFFSTNPGVGTDRVQERMCITPSGNIGIGTAAPIAQLQINSSITNSFYSYRNSGENSAWVVTGDSDVAALRFQNSLMHYRIGIQGSTQLVIRDVTNTGNRVAITSTGEVLINTTTATGTASQPLQITGGAYVSGSVGVGTTNPFSTLDVQGTTYSNRISIGSSSRKSSGLSGAVTDNQLYFYTESDTTTFPIVIERNSPALDNVESLIQFSLQNAGGYYSQAYFGALSTPASDGDLGRGATFIWKQRQGNNSTETMRLTRSGRLGIGSTSPTQTLDVNGGAYIKGTTEIQTNDGSTQSVWTTTLDSKSGSLNNVGLLVQPESVYSGSGTYSPVVFSAGISTSVPGGNIYGVQNYVNIAKTGSVDGSITHGIYNVVARNSTSDTAYAAVGLVYVSRNEYQQGTSIGSSSRSGNIWNTFNQSTISKGTSTAIYNTYNNTQVASVSSGQTASVSVAYGSYNIVTVGSGVTGGIGTLTNYYGYYVLPISQVTGQLTNYYGLYLDTPIVNGTLTNRYSIYSEDASSPMHHAGSIGIGTTNPSSKLHVVGDTLVTGVSTIVANSSTEAFRITQLGTGNALVVEDSTNPDASPFVIDNIGNVGIGTTNPQALMQVGAANSQAFVVAQVGIAVSVGIGTTNPRSALDVNGNALFNTIENREPYFSAPGNLFSFPGLENDIKYPASSYEITEVQCVADVAGSLNNTYFTLYGPVGLNTAASGIVTTFNTTLTEKLVVVWFNVAGAGVTPSVVGAGRSVGIAITSGASAVSIASSIATTFSSDTTFTVGDSGIGTVYFAANTPNNFTDSSAGTSGFAVTTTSNGSGSLSGSAKWYGGVLAPNGKIYGIPAVSSSVLVIDPSVVGAGRSVGIAITSGASAVSIASSIATTFSSDTTFTVGDSGIGTVYFAANTPNNFTDSSAGTSGFAVTTTSNGSGSLSGSAKWYGGVLAPNGKIYGIPAVSSSVLVIDPATGITTTFGSLSGTYKWIGGVLAPNGKIYGIPYASTSVLVIDPATNTTSTFGSLSGSSKWYGGVLAPNGKIYGIPFTSTSVLVIDPAVGTATTFGSLSGTNKWDGGVLAPNGKIYGIPYDSTSVLVIDPATNTTSTFGSLSGSSKWSGGVLAPNGKIYGIPFNSTSVLVIDPATNTTSTFGSLSGSNKWVKGVLAPNGKIYCISYDSTSVLVIDPSTNTTSTFGSLSGTAKWVGGVLAPNGKIYGIPSNSTNILSIGGGTAAIPDWYLSAYQNKF